jgi:1-deoxy-D-xylulose-5-phosphate synthase
MAPKDENELRQMLYSAYMYNRPAAIRYPRGEARGSPYMRLLKKYARELGILREGEKCQLLLAAIWCIPLWMLR